MQAYTPKIGDLSDGEIAFKLKNEGLAFTLGPFKARIKARYPSIVSHLRSLYANVPLLNSDKGFVHQSVRLDAPNWLRRVFRSQVVAHTRPQMPMVPLPTIHAPLAFEMALNFAVATGWYRHLLLHAGVVADEKGAIVISAGSGAGKSTLTAALTATGMRLLSDEFGLVETGTPQLIGYPRPISFKNESIEQARLLFDADRLSNPLRATPKGSLAYLGPEPDWIAKALIPASCRLILFPQFTKGASPAFSPVSKSIALTKLNASSPNIQIVGEGGFQSLVSLVETAPAYDLTYGSTDDALSLVEKVQQDADL